jgi:hypothetical protein
MTLGGAMCVVLVGAVAAQNPPVRNLKLDFEYAEPFTCVSGFRELSDGRVVVSDVREKRVEIIDLRRGTITKVGREGQGPGEWSVPQGMYALSGDTTLMWDPQNRRFLTIRPDGSVGKEVVVDITAGGGAPPAGPVISGGSGGGRAGAAFGGMAMASVRGPAAVDRMGRFYYQGSPLIIGADGTPVSADSAAIMRFDPRTSRLDTVAFLQLARSTVQTSSDARGGGRSSTSVMMLGANPFAPAASWAVAPDGRIAIVHPNPYRVEWISPTKARTVGPAVSYERLRLTEADKAPPRAPVCPITISMGGGGGAPVGAAATSVTQTRVSVGGGPGGAPRTDWPEVKPPFVSGRYGGALVAPNGELWIGRSRAVDDPPSYDIFDASGKLTARAVLPKGTRVVGFGNGTLYGYRMDDDDLVYLQRFRLDATR